MTPLAWFIGARLVLIGCTPVFPPGAKLNRHPEIEGLPRFPKLPKGHKRLKP